MAKKFENSINVFAPATVANLACGFDVMGLAIDSPGDEVHVEFNRNKEIRIRKISGDGGKLSLDPQKNTAAVSIQSLIDWFRLLWKANELHVALLMLTMLLRQ